MQCLILLFLLAAKPHHPVKHKSVISANHDSMIIQNREIDRLQLPRIVDDNQLHQLERTGELIRINDNDYVSCSKVVAEDRRYVRPWTAKMVDDMSFAFYDRFRISLVIDSAVRTVEQQQKLRRTNRYAAPETGVLPSSHLAGTTVDIAKRRYSSSQRRWIVLYLKDLQDKGLVIATEEPACYHVFTMERYYENANHSTRTTDSG